MEKKNDMNIIAPKTNKKWVSVKDNINVNDMENVNEPIKFFELAGNENSKLLNKKDSGPCYASSNNASIGEIKKVASSLGDKNSK